MPWLWLLCGLVLLPFTLVQTMIPVAAWLAPVLLLRFTRTLRSASIALSMVFAAQMIGNAIALRGGDVTNIYVMVIGLALFAVFRGFLSTLPYAADRLIGRRLGTTARVFMFPLAFTTVDWLASVLPALNTSGSTVYSQFDSLALLQITSITGMWGISFLIGWGAATANALWEDGWIRLPARRMAVAFALAMVAVLLYGGIRLNLGNSSSSEVVAATVSLDRSLHKNAFAPPFDWLTFNRSSDAERAAVRPQLQATVDQMLQRTVTALRAGAKIVGWQETAAFVLAEDRQQVLDSVAALARQYDSYVQIALGIFTRRDTLPYFLNQSILIDSSGLVLWTFEKRYPVIPGESYVTPHGDPELPAAETRYGRISTAICNDFHFPALIRQAGRTDADIMMAPYNDVHPFEQQDAEVSIMRAIENGYSMVRPTGFGPSLIVDNRGRVVGRQEYGEGGGVMLASIPTLGMRTVYSLIGDIFAFLCAAGFVALGAYGLMRRQVGETP
jgi:apolipoprotein N-acyltransferase